MLWGRNASQVPGSINREFKLALISKYINRTIKYRGVTNV